MQLEINWQCSVPLFENVLRFIIFILTFEDPACGSYVHFLRVCNVLASENIETYILRRLGSGKRNLQDYTTFIRSHRNMTRYRSMTGYRPYFGLEYRTFLLSALHKGTVAQLNTSSSVFSTFLGPSLCSRR